MRNIVLGVLIVAASLVPAPDACAQRLGGPELLVRGEGGGGSGSNAGVGAGVGAGRGAARENSSSPASAPSVTPSGERVAGSAPSSPKPAAAPKDTPKPQTVAAPTKQIGTREFTQASVGAGSASARAQRGWVGPTTSARDNTPATARHAPSVVVVPSAVVLVSPTADPSQPLTYERKVKAAQQAYFAVQIRYKMRTPRPRIQVPKKETSRNEVDWGDVTSLLIDAARNPRDPEVWVDMLIMVAAPTELGTSSELMWTDGPYREEVELMRRVKDVLESMPPSERRAALHRWIESQVWDHTHKPFIAVPRPL
jgi:hypothetical protein